MQTVIRQLPTGLLPDGDLYRRPDGRPETRSPHCIYLWITLTPDEVPAPGPDAKCLPAVLDTGFNDTAFVTEDDLRLWLGSELADALLRPTNRTGTGIRWNGIEIAKYRAAAWLWPNRDGRREPDREAKPACLELPDGVAIARTDQGVLKPPLLGLRAVHFGGWDIAVSGVRECVSIALPVLIA